jgi:hypothetical protein
MNHFLLRLCLPLVAQGPLRVHADSPLYFTDGSGKAILLTGAHVWQNLQDHGFLTRGAAANPPTAFHYLLYLNHLRSYGHNFVRLLRWETAKWTDNHNDGNLKYAANHPWLRPGPGLAGDGAPRFDLERFDTACFQRLRDRAEQTSKLGIYVSFEHFEGWEIQFSDG